MFEQIERQAAGEKGALERASDLSGQSREQLSSARKEFERVSSETQAIKAVDEALKQLTDYSVALMRARVSRDGPVARSVREALEQGAIGLVQMCVQSITDLLDANKPMGKVYQTIGAGKAPLPEELWAALAQWNDTLIRGRLISAIFTVQGQ